jgi:predicted RNA binding protein YcfA (HicA-like mRNA interferase family)
MVDGFYKDVCKELAAAGYTHVGNAKGSHEKWRHAAIGKIVIVPRNLKSRHTANGILKDAGLTKRY